MCHVIQHTCYYPKLGTIIETVTIKHPLTAVFSPLTAVYSPISFIKINVEFKD